MALLVLASTVSWTVGQHYCMGRLMNVSLFEHAEDCGMDMGLSETSFSDFKKSCCSDKIVVIEGQDDLKLSFDETSIEAPQLIVAPTISFNLIFEAGTEAVIVEDCYPPPLIVKNIQLLDEVFLI